MVVVSALAVALKGGGGQRGTGEPALPAREAVRRAFGHGSYLLLVAGFFVCGFHVAFITTHLPAHIAVVAGHSHAGMDTAGPAVAAWALALIGLFNIVGSYGSGVLGARHSKRQLLAGIYLARAVVIALFITLPPTPAVVLVFAAAMGVLWLSTVPLTSGLVAVMFGTSNLGTLFGMVFFSHQVGAFLGVWLGGLAMEQTGSFMPVWLAGIALGRHCRGPAQANRRAPRAKLRGSRANGGLKRLRGSSPGAPEEQNESRRAAMAESVNATGRAVSSVLIAFIPRRIWAASLRRGNGSSGSGTPRNSHKGSQPSLTS